MPLKGLITVYCTRCNKKLVRRGELTASKCCGAIVRRASKEDTRFRNQDRIKRELEGKR